MTQIGKMASCDVEPDPDPESSTVDTDANLRQASSKPAMKYEPGVPRSNESQASKPPDTYCGGAPRPRLRGVLHGAAAATSPIWAYVLISAPRMSSASAWCIAGPVVNSACLLACFLTSAIYHIFPWRHVQAELLMQRIDRSMISVAFAGILLHPLIFLFIEDFRIYGILALLVFILTWSFSTFQ